MRRIVEEQKMNKKTEMEIARLENSILANNHIIKNHPELTESTKKKTEDIRKRIEELKTVPVNVVKNKELQAGQDLGWNCLAVQKNGAPCKCNRKYGNYCKRHLEHYVIEKEGLSDE